MHPHIAGKYSHPFSILQWIIFSYTVFGSIAYTAPFTAPPDEFLLNVAASVSVSARVCQPDAQPEVHLSAAGNAVTCPAEKATENTESRLPTSSMFSRALEAPCCFARNGRAAALPRAAVQTWIFLLSVLGLALSMLADTYV